MVAAADQLFTSCSAVVAHHLFTDRLAATVVEFQIDRLAATAYQLFTDRSAAHVGQLFAGHLAAAADQLFAGCPHQPWGCQLARNGESHYCQPNLQTIDVFEPSEKTPKAEYPH